MEIDVVDPIVIGVTIPTIPSVGVSTTDGNVVVVVPFPGAQGIQGPPGTNSPIAGDTLTGVQNGSNEVYTTSHAFVASSTAVYRNGLREELGVGYTESGSAQITFTTPPLSSDVITIDYLAQ